MLNHSNKLSSENLKFNITLSGTFWDKKPQFSVWLDDHVVIQSEIQNQPHQLKFERSVEDGKHSIKIRLENKTNQDTIIVNNEIVKDMLLNIDDISIENISLGNLLWSAEYYLDTPQEFQGKTITQLDNCVNLGWNGTYIFKFSSPFYLWLLEKL